jgi:hypothetical protein
VPAGLFRALLPAPFLVRLAGLVVALAPLGFVMGIPFPVGLRATVAGCLYGLAAWTAPAPGSSCHLLN